MNMIYNSPTYCVVEFGAINGNVRGYEIMDKMSRREIYLEGSLAMQFKQQVQKLISAEPSNWHWQRSCRTTPTTTSRALSKLTARIGRSSVYSTMRAPPSTILAPTTWG